MSEPTIIKRGKFTSIITRQNEPSAETLRLVARNIIELANKYCQPKQEEQGQNRPTNAD